MHPRLSKTNSAPAYAAWLLVALLAALCLTGCGTRTILVPPGDPVQIREPVKARVWVFDARGERAPGEVTLPAGWYALPQKEK